jgi:hypothetical protein
MAIQSACRANAFTIVSTGVSTLRIRSKIHPTDAAPPKTAPPNRGNEYARVLFISISVGRMITTTSIRIVSIPRLKARMPATRSQRPNPSRSNVAAKAKPWMRPKKAAIHASLAECQPNGCQGFESTEGHCAFACTTLEIWANGNMAAQRKAIRVAIHSFSGLVVPAERLMPSSPCKYLKTQGFVEWHRRAREHESVQTEMRFSKSL